VQSKAIIFDYNRTIYDPESGSQYPEVQDLLAELRKRGFKTFLISKGDEERRMQITELGLLSLFDDITVVKEKSREDFQRYIELCPAGTKVYVVGDRVRKEIRFGNELGAKTVWLKKGKFSDELPEDDSEKPHFTISSLNEVLDILSNE